MTGGLKGSASLFTSSDGDLLIEAFAPVEGAGPFRRIVFRASRIGYLFEIDDKLSGIKLDDGVTIPVAMDIQTLKQNIYDRDLKRDNSLDLSSVTGEAVGAVQAVRLATTFNPAAEKTKEIQDKPLKIAFFARKYGEKSYRLFIVDEGNINWGGATQYDTGNSQIGKSTYLPLVGVTDPFGNSETNIDMKCVDFMEIYNKAKIDGLDELDLREKTRCRTKPSLPPLPPGKYAPGSSKG